MNTEILSRKGARKAQNIPNNVLKFLNEGKIETVNLTEWLVVDHLILIENVLPTLGISKDHLSLISKEIKAQKKLSTMQTTKLIGSMLYQLYAESKNFEQLFEKLSAHPSDSIRCYAPYLIGLNEKWSIEEKLLRSEKLAADKHFGVREVVWMAMRPEIEENLSKSIDILSKWTFKDNEYVRRFASESIRPRGVWCKHIERLKQEPEMALPILENLRSDASKYVQDSVGNWLNDASKSRPNFVMKLCEKWQRESPTKETEKIIKRARRTIDKK